MQIPKFPPTKIDYIEFDGGLDVVTPALRIPSGFVRAAQNFEIAPNGGYKFLTGYERLDGRDKPSDASYTILAATITGAYAVGNTLTGVTSGATGVIAAVADDESYFVLTKVTGTFDEVGEDLQIAAVTIATCDAVGVLDGASTAKLHAQYNNAAADIYRADITEVPGSGNILGLVLYNDVWYAWRNNAGGTAAAIYKSSAAGWVNVPLGYEISFTGGGGDIDEGDTLTQGGVTATIKRVVITSGTLAGANAAGRLIIHTIAGGNFAAGAATTTGAGALTLSGAQTAITLNPGGRYECKIENLGGATGTKRIYGCDGVNRGFEFDGTDYGYVPITTGMTTDTPNHLWVHKFQLFFSFGPSVQHSGPGTPYVWSPVLGAAEIAMGDDVTAFVGMPGSEAGAALVIFCRNRGGVLYGSSSADWNLVPFGDDKQGAVAYSAQRIVGRCVAVDDRGITDLAATQAYGNFASATLSQRISTLMPNLRGQVTASCVAYDSNQYRVFFADNTGLYLTFKGNKIRGIMPVEFPDSVECIWSGEMSDGAQAIAFGSSDGFVYEMEKGTSFDGDAIAWYFHLVFNSSKSARQLKKYKRAAFEVSGSGYAEFSFRYEVGYASAEYEQPSAESDTIDFSPVFWDSFVWDSFVWDGTALAPSSFPMDGSAANASLIVQGSSDYFAPMTFSGAFLHYIPRRAIK